MIIESNINKIPYEMSLSKFFRQVTKGYHFDYNIRNINPSKLAKLCAWPSDKDITSAIKHSYKLASELAKALDMDPTSNMNHSLLLLFVMIEHQNLEVSTEIKSILELKNDLNDEIEISEF
ncbi:hypothetical protein RirG_124500 [Rhizophagus irregularis DAOM 197198w]|uniref:Uncharacterized protein n=3 Tax=Rhizophagus irregularis TaxID=588596 RepID=A0A015MHM2_RHIIW|nr:hypothetical protein RirG_124500 [Rhizophagus irregularis DAOM 197198w]